MEEPVVSFIVNQLGNLLVEEAKFLCGVNDQVEDLKAELNRMMAFLQRISGIKDGDPMLTNWEDEVRELAYDSQDVIETFVLQVSSRTRKGSFRGILRRFACILNEAYLVHKVGSQISTIKGKISSFNRSLEVHGIKRIEGHVGESNSSHGWRKTYHHVEEDPVGLEADVAIVVQQLVEDEDCRIISIFGLGGLGKTTLARSVFHHRDVESHFNGNIAWACISQQYNPRDILQGILVKLLARPKEEVEKMSKDELWEHLYQVQKEKKCLVVLDDIWSYDAWSNFKDAFPIHGQTTTGSKILITTRDQALGRQIHPSCFCHQPSHLDEEESWELLKRKALGRTNDIKISPEMEAEGRKMAKECKGLPLAIIVLGGLLANKGTVTGWQEAYKMIKSQRRSKDHEREDEVSKVLSLSYHDLPYKYKPCFLYLSNFPEDYEIHAKTLYRLWIAEDIVSTDDKLEDEIMMDVAERYLDVLVRRCIVQVARVKFSGKIKYCRIHDEMRGFCLTKAKRHNFLTVIHPGDVTDQVDCSSIPSTKIRRLAVPLSRRHEDKVELPQSNKFHYLRSILFFNRSSYDSETETETELDWNFKNFKLLKTLQLECCSFLRQNSESMGKLVGLRYLSSYRCGGMEWATFLHKLRNLQTLEIWRGDGPIGFENMGQLRHLGIYDWGKSKIKLLGLTNLETLEGFNINNFDVNDLFKLKNLRRLVKARIDLSKEDQAFEILAAFVKYLNSSESHRLQKSSVKLVLDLARDEKQFDLIGQLFECPRLSNLDLKCIGLSRLPEFNCSTSGLTYLAFEETTLQEDPMPTLERLPKLQRLSINFAGNRIMTCSAGGFPQLKTLRIAYLDGLKEWRVDEGAMPNLSTLEINSCNDLEKFPDGLRSITTLETILTNFMPETFVSGARAGNFHKVHVIDTTEFKIRASVLRAACLFEAAGRAAVLAGTVRRSWSTTSDPD